MHEVLHQAPRHKHLLMHCGKRNWNFWTRSNDLLTNDGELRTCETWRAAPWRHKRERDCVVGVVLSAAVGAWRAHLLHSTWASSSLCLNLSKLNFLLTLFDADFGMLLCSTRTHWLHATALLLTFWTWITPKNIELKLLYTASHCANLLIINLFIIKSELDDENMNYPRRKWIKLNELQNFVQAAWLSLCVWSHFQHFPINEIANSAILVIRLLENVSEGARSGKNDLFVRNEIY